MSAGAGVAANNASMEATIDLHRAIRDFKNRERRIRDVLELADQMPNSNATLALQTIRDILSGPLGRRE